MRYDKNWKNLYFPDFTPFRNLTKDGIMLMAADMFAPDGAFPDDVKAALHKAVDDNLLHYPGGDVMGAFEEAIAKKVLAFNGLAIGPERRILITPGSAFGLFLSIRALVDPNEESEVINFDPTFAENINDVVMMGAKNVFCPLSPDNGYQIVVSELEKYITPKTRCIVLTNPANPIGTVARREVLEDLAKLLIKHDLYAVVDQCFERSVYDGREYTTLAALPGMAERVLTVFGPSKEVRLSGMRIGYVIGPPDIMEKMAVATNNYVGLPGTLAMVAATAAYGRLEADTASYLSILDRRRREGQKILDSIPNVHCPLPEAGFSFWLDIHKLGTSDEIVDYLVREADVGVGPGTWFGSRGEGFLRVMFACYADDAVIFEAFERMKKALTKLS